MGIFIYEAVSKSVTSREWERVYEETLVLVNAFSLAERGTITYAGKDILCAVPTKERARTFWNSENSKSLGWCASMDYGTLDGAEEYYLPRNLIDPKEIDYEAGDAMMGALPACMDYCWEDEQCSHTYSLWDSKTQGRPYHMYLLAVACLIEDRLGEKAFVYGDITQGQCRKAVEMANQYLSEPIRVPARCEKGRLYRRVQKLPLDEREKIGVFEHFYLGVKGEAFYNFERSNFRTDAILEYWRKRFHYSHIGTIGFLRNLKEYLSSGASLEELCKIVHMEDQEGNPQCERFIKSIMDAKLHIREKNTEDYLEIDQNSEHPYGIESLFAGFAFGSAHNPKVDRYIPVDEIRESLKREIGTMCDVDTCIDQYLKEEASAPEIDVYRDGLSDREFTEMVNTDAAEVFKQLMDKKQNEFLDQREKYEISEYKDLIYFKKDSTIAPGLKKSLGKSFQFYHSMIEEEFYKELMKQTHEERCGFLIEQNQYLLLRDRDWLRIFSNIEQNPETFERYYPMVRVRIENRGLNQMTMAFVLNDELYAVAEKWSRELE